MDTRELANRKRCTGRVSESQYVYLNEHKEKRKERSMRTKSACKTRIIIVLRPPGFGKNSRLSVRHRTLPALTTFHQCYRRTQSHCSSICTPVVFFKSDPRLQSSRCCKPSPIHTRNLFSRSDDMISSDDWSSLHERAKQEIDCKAEELNKLSQAIWSRPELAYEEQYAHEILTNFLEKEGFKVERKFIVDTGFRATYGSDAGLNICLICEYDALPEIGHACGHNLIAEVGIAAGIAVKAALEMNHGRDGKVTVIGTPAEEGGAGKVKMIEGNAFGDVDVAMMVHPKPFTITTPKPLALQTMTITYHGKPAHAASFPWDGKNALDAAIMCYQSISVMRQQMKPDWRVHGIISNGGKSAGVIPEVTELQYYVRAPNKAELEDLKERVEGCIKGAATASRCEVKYEYKHCYLDLITNSILAALYEKQGTELGIEFSKDKALTRLIGSTDMGNVSHVVPSIHPLYDINTDAPNHTREFAKASGAPEAQEPTLTQAKALALTALELLKPGNEGLLQSIHAEFEDTTKNL